MPSSVHPWLGRTGLWGVGCWSGAGGPRGMTGGPQLSAGAGGLDRGGQGRRCHTTGLSDST